MTTKKDSFSVGVIGIGNELLSGHTQDTNTRYLCLRLRSLGISVERIVIVGDNRPDIVHATRELSDHVSLIVTSGGLGPTSDDVTREALAEFFGTTLELSQEAKQKLEERARQRGRALNENNLRQAYFPQGATRYPNPYGTADMFSVTSGQRLTVFSLPGVPFEFERLVDESVVPWLCDRLPQTQTRYYSQTLQIFGLSESWIGSVIEQCHIPDDILIAYRPNFPEVSVTFSLWSGDEAVACNQLSTVCETASAALGVDFVHARNEQSLAATVAETLVRAKKTIAVAESCTGGLLSHLLVSVPGASEFFRAGVVSYANEAKELYLGVHPDVLKTYGAVSAEVATEMAYGARVRTGADFAVSVTGIAGPDGGTREKPLGTVFFGLASSQKVEVVERHLPMERNAFRKYCAYCGLDLIRRKVLDLELHWEGR